MGTFSTDARFKSYSSSKESVKKKKTTKKTETKNIQ